MVGLGLAGAAELRVLLIGNSQINANNLPSLLQTMAAGSATTLAVTNGAIDGQSLRSLYDLGTGSGTPRAKIATGNWDWVVLQDWYGQNNATEFTGAVQDFRGAVGAAPGGTSTRVLLLATASINSMYPDGFATIRNLHRTNAASLGLPWADAGGSWLTLWGPSPTSAQRLALYHSDQAHPGIRGSVIYAASLYAEITGLTPVGLPDPTGGVMTPTELTAAQQAAWTTKQEKDAGGGGSGGSGGSGAANSTDGGSGGCGTGTTLSLSLGTLLLRKRNKRLVSRPPTPVHGA